MNNKVLTFLRANPKLGKYLREQGVHILKIQSIEQIRDTALLKQSYVKTSITSRFKTYKIKYGDIIISVDTDDDFSFFSGLSIKNNPEILF